MFGTQNNGVRKTQGTTRKKKGVQNKGTETTFLFYPGPIIQAFSIYLLNKSVIQHIVCAKYCHKCFETLIHLLNYCCVSKQSYVPDFGSLMLSCLLGKILHLSEVWWFYRMSGLHLEIKLLHIMHFWNYLISKHSCFFIQFFFNSFNI